MFGKRNDEKITEDEFIPAYTMPKHVLDKAVREYEQGKLTHLENSKDPTVQSVLNELAVRRNDDYYHGRRK